MTASIALTRRSLLAGAAGLLAAPRAYAADSTLPFVVIGDWGQQRSPDQQLVAAAMGRAASDIHSRFVISTGDNFYTRGVHSTDDPQWRETFENVYTARALQTPWYVVLGNHDYRGSPAAQVAYTEHSNRWRMPARHWRQQMQVGAKSVSLFFLDTTPIVRMQEAEENIPLIGDAHSAHQQLHWLETELAACRSDWKIAIGHHPVISSGRHGGSPLMQTRVRPLFERFGVQAYFNGHDHDLEHLVEDGVNYICSGGGAEGRPMNAIAASRFAFPHPGFVACELHEDVLAVRFHNEQGAVLYEASLPRRG